MSLESAIEWTDATWNPVTGCTKISAGCDYCYAERFAERWRNVKGHAYEQGFDLRLWPSRIDYPKRWRKPRMIFVNSMSDLFHKNIPQEFIDDVFTTMEFADWHIYQVLTKRSSLMCKYLQNRYAHRTMPKHIWCGVTVESEAYTVRITHLRNTPAQTKFLSIEPLIAPITQLDLEGIDWVIVGGESGPNARPMKLEWVQQIRDKCIKCAVPFFFKQWGGIRPKSGGRELQGKEYNEIPHNQRRLKMKKFEWNLNESPPPIESHSQAKLDVLRSYLEQYFNTLNRHPGAEEFKLDLVNGFCGGGLYQSDGGQVSGSPLVMLEETRKAEQRINEMRKKPIHFNVKFHFVDLEKRHTDYLRSVLKQRGYDLSKDQIEIHTAPFEKVAKNIVGDIKKRQPRSGRSLFLLDQKGYSAVHFDSIRQIFQELRNAEVILTFAAETLRVFAQKGPVYLKGLIPAKLGQREIDEILEDDSKRGRGVLQRVLRVHIRRETGAMFDTPFFLRPKKSRRALWFLHLSRHAKARDVMIERHWDVQNTFEHIGTGGFQMLGYDAILHSSEPELFNFTEMDNDDMRKELLNQMPDELYDLVGTDSLSVGAIHQKFSNKTAARFSDMDEIILRLVKEREFDLIGADGRNRNRKRIKTINPTDSIVLPSHSLLQIFSRRKDKKNS